MNASELRAAASLKEIGEDIMRTMRELALYEVPSRPVYPPPHDWAAERSVLEALLCGRRKPSELACKATDFYLNAHRAIAAVLEAAEELGHEPRIVDVLEMQGASRQRAEAFVLDIVQHEPVNAFVDDAAERLVELACRRRLIERMQQIDAAWRLVEDVPREQLLELKEAIERWL